MFSRRRFFEGVALSLFLGTGCGRQASMGGLHVGEHILSVTLKNLSGESVTLPDASSPCLINFWATWCPPCRAEMAGLARLARDFSPRGLSVQAVSVDSDIFLVKEYLAKEGISLAVLLDEGGKVARGHFRVPGYPTSYLVDRAGLVSEVWVGQRDWDAEALRRLVESAL